MCVWVGGGGGGVKEGVNLMSCKAETAGGLHAAEHQSDAACWILRSCLSLCTCVCFIATKEPYLCRQGSGSSIVTSACVCFSFCL